MPVRSTVTRKGVELVYWTWPGAAPPTLLLHGIGNYGRYWDLFADAITDALAVLDRIGIKRAVIVGHSMGGLHSINLAARHPERVLALVIVDASPDPLPQGAERAQRLLTGRPERFADRAAARAYLERTSPGYAAAVYENRLAFAFREEDGGLVWRSDAGALRRIMSGRMPAEDRWDALASITCPTLVVRGTRSNVLSEDVARRMVQTLADGRLMELDGRCRVRGHCRRVRQRGRSRRDTVPDPARGHSDDHHGVEPADRDGPRRRSHPDRARRGHQLAARASRRDRPGTSGTELHARAGHAGDLVRRLRRTLADQGERGHELPERFAVPDAARGFQRDSRGTALTQLPRSFRILSAIGAATSPTFARTMTV
ncbi:MAG: alpha/beta hydrolase [Chloroflexi bacterium]|nr:MAG: alpha/beta hydrolase [Chloroflexota bacterium]